MSEFIKEFKRDMITMGTAFVENESYDPYVLETLICDRDNTVTYNADMYRDGTHYRATFRMCDREKFLKTSVEELEKMINAGIFYNTVEEENE